MPNGSLLNLKRRAVRMLALLVTLSLFATAAGQNKEALISDALSAAPPKVAKTAKVVDWDGTVLRHVSRQDMDGVGRRVGEQEALESQSIWLAICWSAMQDQVTPFCRLIRLAPPRRSPIELTARGSARAMGCLRHCRQCCCR